MPRTLSPSIALSGVGDWLALKHKKKRQTTRTLDLLRNNPK